jgi:hypothetical protein
MRELAILGCLVAMSACTGKTGAANDTAHRDSTIVAGPPAVVSSPPEIAKSAPSPAAARDPKPSARAAMPATKPQPPQTSGTADSTRGIVSVVGTTFDKRVMIAAPGGHRTEITGSLAALVGHLAGAEVSVVGVPSGTTLDATAFLVRTVDGAPAIDGTLKTEGAFLYITTANGTRTRIATPPPALTGRDGVRVWVTGDPSKGISSFGFIDPPR